MCKNKAFQKIRDMAFARKVILTYAISLAIVVALVVVNQVHQSLQVVEYESRKNIAMLTDQVTLNFTENQQNLSSRLYARLRTFQIPDLMDDGKHATLQRSLSQTISYSGLYDYVLIELQDGTRMDAKSARYSQRQAEDIRKNANDLLDGEQGSRGFTKQWLRLDDSGVFYVLDIYDTEPLKFVGKAVFHMDSIGFTLTDIDNSTGMLFFDSSGRYFTCVGASLAEQDKSLITTLWDAPLEELSSPNYFLSRSNRDGWIAIGYTSREANNQIRRTTITNGVKFGILGLLFGVLMIALLLRALNYKLNELKKTIAYVSEGRFDYQVPIQDNDDITQICKAFNSMTCRIAELLNEVVEKERLRKDADFQILEYQYRGLQTQIRPHFIYNAFETVSAMAKIKGDQEIIDIVKRISKYFRNITVNTTQQFLTIQQEFDALESYTEVYRYIHGNALDVQFSAKPAARDALIPTMLVQPLVENAMEHGLRSPDEQSQIIVHAYILDDNLNVTVKDNGSGLTDEQVRIFNSSSHIASGNQDGIGLGNVRKRLALIYGDRASLAISNRPEGGTVVKIILPMSYIEPPLPGEVPDD